MRYMIDLEGPPLHPDEVAEIVGDAIEAHTSFDVVDIAPLEEEVLP